MSIYSGPGRAQRILTTGGTDLNDQLADWTAHTVVADNHTSQYVFFEDAGPNGRYVPPWAFGVTIPLPAVMRARARFKTPPGIPAALLVAGQQVVLTYFSEAIDPSPGLLVNAFSGALPGTATGNLAKLGDTVAISCPGSAFVGFVPSVGAQLATGTTLRFEGTADGVIWQAIPVLYQTPVQASWASSDTSGSVGIGSWIFVVATAGLTSVRARLTAAGGGQASFSLTAVATPGAGPPLPFAQQNSLQSQPVVVASDQWSAGIGPRNYDKENFHGPAAGTVATTTIAPDANKNLTVACIVARVTSGGTGGAIRAQLTDGVATLWETILGCPTTANLSDGVALSGLGIPLTAGRSATLQFSVGIATAFEEVYVGAYQN